MNAILQATSTSRVRQQTGAALAISLIFLLVLTVLSIAAMRGSGLQERMAGGMYEATIAFQAAESGLLAAEAWLGSPAMSARPTPVTSCSGSGCRVNQVLHTTLNIGGGGDVDYSPLTYNWTAFDWDNHAVNMGGDGKQFSLGAEDPSYIIQQTGFSPDSFVIGSNTEGTYYYTVTARGVGRSTSHQTILQTVFARRF